MQRDQPQKATGQEQNPTESGEQEAPPLAAQQAGPTGPPGPPTAAQQSAQQPNEGPPGPPRAPQPDPADYAASGSTEGLSPGESNIAYKDIDKEAEQAAGPFGERQPGQEGMSDQQVHDQAIYDQSIAMAADADKFGYFEVGAYNSYVHVPDPDRPVTRFIRVRVIGQELPPPGVDVDPGFFKQMLWAEKPGNYTEHTTIGGKPIRDIITKQAILREPHTPSLFMPGWADAPVEVVFPVYEGSSDAEALEEIQTIGLKANLQEFHQARTKVFGFVEGATLGAPHMIPGYAQLREGLAQESPPWISEAAFGAGHVMATPLQFKVFGAIMMPVHTKIASGFATSITKAAATQVTKAGTTSLGDAAMKAVQGAQQASKPFSPTGTLAKMWQRSAKNVPSGVQRTLERAWAQAAEGGALPQGVAGETLTLGVPRAVWNSPAGATLRRAAEAYKMALGEEVAGTTLFKFVAISTNIVAGATVDATLGTAQAAGAAVANTMLTPEQRVAQLRSSPQSGMQEGLVGAAFEILTSTVPGMRRAFAPGKAAMPGSKSSARPAHPGPPPGAVWGAGDTNISAGQQPGAEVASPGASQHRSLQVVPPPTPGVDVKGRQVADQIQQNLRNSLDDDVTAQVDHTLRGLTRSQYDAAQRGAQAAEMQDMQAFQMANMEVRQNAEVIVKRMEALRDLAHGDLGSASVAAGVDFRKLLYQPAVDPQTGMIEGVLWDLARWAEPLGKKLTSLDADTRKNIVSRLPELASHLDVVGMKARLTALATELARVDSNAAVAPPKNVTFDGPIPRALVGRGRAETTPTPDLGLKREMRVEDAPTSEDWIDDPGKAMAHTQVLADQLVSGHSSVPLGAISLDPAKLPVYEAAGLIPLEDGRVGAAVYLEDGRVVVMRTHPEGGVYAVDISKGVKAAMFPAAADPKVVNGGLSPFEWSIDDAGHFLVEGQSAANKKNQEIFKQQVQDTVMQGPPLGSTPDQLFQTASSHEFFSPESYHEMLDQAAKLDKDMVLPTLKDAARYYPKELAYSAEGRPTQMVLERQREMTKDYMRQKMALEETRHIAFTRINELKPINERRPDLNRPTDAGNPYNPVSGPRRPLQTAGQANVVTGIEANRRGKWTTDQLSKHLQKQGLTSSQVDALNLTDAFAGRKTVSRTDLLDWLYENTMEVEVHSFSNDAGFPHRRANSGWEQRKGTYYTQTATRPGNGPMAASGGGITSTRVEIVNNGTYWEAFSVTSNPDPNAMSGVREAMDIISESPEAVMAMVDDALKGTAPDFAEWSYPLNGGALYEETSIRSPLVSEMQTGQDLVVLEAQVKTLESELTRLGELVKEDPSPPMLLELQTVTVEHAKARQDVAALVANKESGAVPEGSDTVAHFSMDRHFVGDKIIDVAQEIHSDIAIQQRARHKDRIAAIAQRYNLIPGHADMLNTDINFRDLEEKIRVVAADWELEVIDANGIALDAVTEVPLSWKATNSGDSESAALSRVNQLRTNGVADSPLLSPTHMAPMALKAALKRAAERGATHFAFTNGQINSVRHNRVQLTRLNVTPRENGTFDIDYLGAGADPQGNNTREGSRMVENERQLADVLGTSVADLVMKRLGTNPELDTRLSLTEADLTAAAFTKTPWAKELYDEALPRAAKKLIKKQKWDTKLEPLDIDYSPAMRRRNQQEGDFEPWAEADRSTEFNADNVWETAYEAEMTDWTKNHSLQPRWPGTLNKNAIRRAQGEIDLAAYEAQYGKWYPEKGEPADWAVVDANGGEVSQILNVEQGKAQDQYYDDGNSAIQETVNTRAQAMLDADNKQQAELRDQWENGKVDKDTPEIDIEPLQMIEITPKMRRTLLDPQSMVVKEDTQFDLREGEIALVDPDVVLDELGWAPEPTWQSGVGVIGKATPRVTKSGVMNLRGQTAADPETQATLMRPWRSKKTETLHYLYSGETSGDIQGHMSYSSRLPGSAGLFDYSKETQRIIQEMVDRGATPVEFVAVHNNEVSRNANEMARRVHRLELQKNEKIVIDMVHNHPSGKVKPSDADAFVTAAMGIALKKEGVTLRHHIIINHDKFTVIRNADDGKTVSIEERDLPKFKYESDPLDIPEKPFFLLGHSTKTPMDVASVGGIFNQHPDEFVSVLYSNAKLEAKGMEIVPKSWLKNPRMMQDWLRGRKREHGTSNVFLHYPNLDSTMTDTGSLLLQNGDIQDFVDDSGMSMQQARPLTRREQFNLDNRAAAAGKRVMEDGADYDTRMKALKYAEEGGSFSKQPELFKVLTNDEKSNAMLGRMAKGYISNKVQLDHLNPTHWDEKAPTYFGDWRPTEDVQAQMQKVWDAREESFTLELETISKVKEIGAGKAVIDDDALASIQVETLDKILREDPALFDKFSRQYWRSYDSVLEAMDSKNGLDVMRAESALDAIDDMITARFEEGLDKAEQFDMGDAATRSAADQLEKAAVYKNLEAEAQPWMRPMTVVGWRKQLMHSKELAAAVADGRMDRDIYNNLFKGQTTMNDATQADLDTFLPLLDIIDAHKTFNETTGRFEGVGQDISALLFRAIDGGIPAEKLADYSWKLKPGKLAKETEVRLDEWVPKIRKWYEEKVEGLETAQINLEWTKAARAEKHLGSLTGQINRIFNATAAAMDSDPHLRWSQRSGEGAGISAQDVIDTATSRTKRGDVPLGEMIKLQKSLQSVIKKAETEVKDIEDGKYRRGNYITHIHNLLRPDIKRTLANEADPWLTKLSMQTPEVRFDFLNPRKEGLMPIEDWAHAFKIYSRAASRKMHLEPKLQEAFDLSRSPRYDVSQRDYVDMLIKKLSGEKTDEQKQMRRRMTLSFLMDPKLRREAKSFLAEDRLKAMQLMGDPSKAFSRRMTAAIYAYALNPAFVSGLNVLETRSIASEIAHHIPDLLMPNRGATWVAKGITKGVYDVTRESMSKARSHFLKTPVWQSEATRAHVLDYAHDTTTMLSKMMEGTSEQATHSAMTQRATELYFRASTLQWSESVLRAMSYYTLKQRNQFWGMNEADSTNFAAQLTRHIIPSFGPLDASPKLDTNLGRQALAIQRYSAGQIGDMGIHLGNVLKNSFTEKLPFVGNMLSRPSGGAGNMPFPVDRVPDAATPRESSGDPVRDAAYDMVAREPAEHGHRYDVDTITRWRAASWIGAQVMFLKTMGWYGADLLMEIFDKQTEGWSKAWPYEMRALGGVIGGAIIDLSKMGVYYSNPEAFKDNPREKQQAEAARRRIAGLLTAMVVPGGAPAVGVGTRLLSKEQKDKQKQNKARSGARGGRGKAREGRGGR